MPVYEYLCDQCGERFETVQSFSAAPLTECPTCGGHVHRVIQPVGVIFKGSGFYVTDNRSKSSTMPGGKRSERDSGKDGKDSSAEAVKSGSASSSEAD